MSSWAEICRGSAMVSVPPFLDRTKSRNMRVKLEIPPPPPPSSETNGDVSTNGSAGTEPTLREKVFKFSESAIDKIKSRLSSPEGSKPFSTFLSLSVHIWRHVTVARNLRPEDITVFTIFADCRKRVDPPMPESYFGNLIQRAIDAHDAKAIDERNKEWESTPKIFQLKDAGANCVAVGSSPRFKVYDVDFGWGKPEGVRSGCNNRFDGMVYLYQCNWGLFHPWRAVNLPEVSHLGWGRWYTLRELEAATNGLCAENVIGEGGYGIVYYGALVYYD